jgi:hypothetical protein
MAGPYITVDYYQAGALWKIASDFWQYRWRFGAETLAIRSKIASDLGE